LSGTKCIVDTTKEVAAKKVYSCTEGTLDGTKCIIATKEEKDATPIYSCEAGTTLDESTNKCVSDPYVKEYTCSKGTLDGKKCVIKTTVDKPDECGYTSWSCSNVTSSTRLSTKSSDTFTRKYLYGYYTYEECSRKWKCQDGGTETKTETKDATAVYACKYGTLTNGKCVGDSTLTYKCENGTLNGNKCIVDTTKEVAARLSYSCDEGKLNSNNVCVIPTTKEVTANSKYVCDVGELVNGGKCEISDVLETEYTYTCKYGTLSNNKCVIKTVDTRNVIYACENGYTMADNKCYKITNKSDIVDAKASYKTKTETVYKWSTSDKLEGWTKTGKTRTTNVAVTSSK